MQDSRHFRADQFLRKNSPNSADPHYLVIGFDTEYQREAITNSDGQVDLRNQVLSYQYSCRVITPDNAENEPHWSGIVLPKGRGDDKRLTVTQFIEHALTAGFRAMPKLKVPVDIYLVAHFTRADVPGFNDFKDEASRKAMNLENVRNLFMNVSKDIDVNLKATSGSRPIRMGVKIRDTIALAPTGAKSLAQLGEILGFEKLKLSNDPVQELYFKQHMAEFMEANWRLFREYAIRDAEICAQYTVNLRRRPSDLRLDPMVSPTLCPTLSTALKSKFCLLPMVNAAGIGRMMTNCALWKKALLATVR